MSKVSEKVSSTSSTSTSSKKRGRESLSSSQSKKNVKSVVNDSNKKRKVVKPGQFDPASIKGESTVVYLGHIPKGFAETECRAFFAQFGKVRRVKIFKSEKTGNSKGYGFIQFESHDIAVVVAEALDGYLMSDRQLVCHVIPTNKLHEGMFLPPKQKKIANITDKANKEDSNENVDNVNDNVEVDENAEKCKSEKKIAQVTRLQQKKQKRLKDLGIDFDFF